MAEIKLYKSEAVKFDKSYDDASAQSGVLRYQDAEKDFVTVSLDTSDAEKFEKFRSSVQAFYASRLQAGQTRFAEGDTLIGRMHAGRNALLKVFSTPPVQSKLLEVTPIFVSNRQEHDVEPQTEIPLTWVERYIEHKTSIEKSPLFANGAELLKELQTEATKDNVDKGLPANYVQGETLDDLISSFRFRGWIGPTGSAEAYQDIKNHFANDVLLTRHHVQFAGNSFNVASFVDPISNYSYAALTEVSEDGEYVLNSQGKPVQFLIDTQKDSGGAYDAELLQNNPWGFTLDQMHQLLNAVAANLPE